MKNHRMSIAPVIEFWGSSFLCDPQGVMLAQGSVDKQEIILGEIDIDHLEDVRRNWPFLRDRRIDAYEGMSARFFGRTKTEIKKMGK